MLTTLYSLCSVQFNKNIHSYLSFYRFPYSFVSFWTMQSHFLLLTWQISLSINLQRRLIKVLNWVCSYQIDYYRWFTCNELILFRSTQVMTEFLLLFITWKNTAKMSDIYKFITEWGSVWGITKTGHTEANIKAIQ